MRNVTTYLIAVLMLAGALAVVPAVDAQGAAELVVPDGTADVEVRPGFTAGPAPVTNGAPPSLFPGTVVPGTDQHNGPIDITELKVFGETATDISFQLSVASFDRPSTVMPNQLAHMVCFKWSGSGGSYRFVFKYSYSMPPTEPARSPELSTGFFDRLDGDCDPFDTGVSQVQERFSYVEFPITVDYDAGTLTWTVARQQFEELNPDPDPSVTDPKPASGDTLDGLTAHALASAGPSSLYYDTTEPATYTFTTDTGNEHLQVMVPENIQASAAVNSFGTPMYGVEVGSFQTVPVVIENHMGHEMIPKISVTPIEGEAGNWEVRTLPEISLPAKVGDVPGSETITLIVNPAPTVAHREKVRLLVTAIDDTMADMLGAAVVDIVAVAPPKEGSSTVYFHSSGNPCNSQERWMNTLDSDAGAPATQIAFQNCNPQGGADAGRLMTQGENGISFFSDVPFARNYVMSTSEPAKAKVALKSVAKVGNAEQEVGVPTIADVKVEIFSGLEVIGSHTETGVEIGENTDLDLPVPIRGRILGGFGREVLDERPLNVRFTVIPQSRVIEVCNEQDPPEGCGFQRNVPLPTPSGKVFLVLDKTSLDLPIVSSEKAGEQINITKSGALMSMRLSQGEERVFTNPGKTVVYNVTVRNEGVNKDTAMLSAKVNRDGWTVEILPTTEFRLDIGQPRQFNVRVKAADTAREGDVLRIDLTATSKVDPEAVATLPLFVEATTGQQYEDQAIDDNLQKVDDAEESPVGSIAFVVLGLVGLLGVLRRRR